MDEIFAPHDLERLHDLVQVVWGKDEPMPADQFLAALPNAQAVVSSAWRYGDVLDKAPHLRAVLTVSGGFPLDIDYEQCFAKGIRVLSAAPAFARQVAEMALGMALAASREIVIGDMAMRAGEEKWLAAGNVNTFLLYGKPVGFIGFGGIARELWPLLRPFGCPISVHDPWLSDGYLRNQGVEPMSLEQLLETSRVIFVLAVPSSENRKYISREHLQRIQPGAVLVLISRAHVVDFDALTEMVVAEKFKAAIDVFPEEPPHPDHPIRQAPNAVLSAHRAGTVQEGLWEIGQMVVDDLEAIVHGYPPRQLLNAEPELAARYTSNRVPSYKDVEGRKQG
jgi:phosphoglycerate dehydrogenase-like enzyme